jgi:hypothetical protein
MTANAKYVRVNEYVKIDSVIITRKSVIIISNIWKSILHIQLKDLHILRIVASHNRYVTILFLFLRAISRNTSFCSHETNNQLKILIGDNDFRRRLHQLILYRMFCHLTHCRPLRTSENKRNRFRRLRRRLSAHHLFIDQLDACMLAPNILTLCTTAFLHAAGWWVLCVSQNITITVNPRYKATVFSPQVLAFYRGWR